MSDQKSPSAGLPGAGILKDWVLDNFAPPAKPIAKALSQGDGHTTSGLDAAMQAHADKVHPVPSPPPKLRVSP